MIVYLDTSALVKLYVPERRSNDVVRMVEQASTVATARLAHPEAAAAVARLEREGAVSKTSAERIGADLERDFDRLLVVELSAPVARLAATLTRRHALRGSDAVHLASAVELERASGRRPAFCCFDDRLAAAAKAEGLGAA